MMVVVVTVMVMVTMVMSMMLMLWMLITMMMTMMMMAMFCSAFAGNEASVAGIFTDTTQQKPRPMIKECKRYNVIYSEECFRERLSLSRGTFQQLETVTMWSSRLTEFPEKDRTLFTLLGKTNRSDSIGPMTWQPWSKSWHVTATMKNDILGQNVHEVGGPPPYGVDANEVPAPLDAEGKVPLMYFCMSPSYYTMQLDDLPLKGTIDSSPGLGYNAVAHIKASRPYVAICFTKKHADELMEQVVDTIFMAMLDEHNPHLYDAQLAKIFKEASKKEKNPKPGTEKDRNPPPGTEQSQAGGGPDTDNNKGNDPLKTNKPPRKRTKTTKETEGGKPPPKRGKVDDPTGQGSTTNKSKDRLMNMLADLRGEGTTVGDDGADPGEDDSGTGCEEEDDQ